MSTQPNTELETESTKSFNTYRVETLGGEPPMIALIEIVLFITGGTTILFFIANTLRTIISIILP